jgi:hypothetical protein
MTLFCLRETYGTYTKKTHSSREKHGSKDTCERFGPEELYIAWNLADGYTY